MTMSAEAVPAAPGWRDRAASFALPAASLTFAVLVLVAWQYLPPALGVPKYIIPRLSDLVREMGRMWRSESLLTHFISTATSSIWRAPIRWAAHGFSGKSFFPPRCRT